MLGRGLDGMGMVEGVWHDAFVVVGRGNVEVQKRKKEIYRAVSDSIAALLT